MKKIGPLSTTYFNHLFVSICTHIHTFYNLAINLKLCVVSFLGHLKHFLLPSQGEMNDSTHTRTHTLIHIHNHNSHTEILIPNVSASGINGKRLKDLVLL